MEESGRRPAEIAMELGIRRNQFYKWKEQLACKGDEAFPNQRGRPLKESQSELTSLKQENERLREEVEILKLQVKCSFIREHYRDYSVLTLCRVMGVSTSGYYDWYARPESQREQTNRRLLTKIIRIP